VRADKSGDKDLVVHGEACQLGELEAALNGDVLFGYPDSLDKDPMTLGKLG
jgi:hypothetical protein